MQFNVLQRSRGRFAFATLDDGSGRIEVSIWADVFEKYRSLIKKGQLLVVEGIVERDNYSDSIKYKIIAERIMTFDQARREYIKNIKISINSDLENIISDIKEIANNIIKNNKNIDIENLDSCFEELKKLSIQGSMNLIKDNSLQQ